MNRLFSKPLFGVTLLAAHLATGAQPVKPAAADLAFYEQTVKPILAGACFECHSHEAKKFKGGLALDSKSGWQSGGDHGVAIVPGAALIVVCAVLSPHTLGISTSSMR